MPELAILSHSFMSAVSLLFAYHVLIGRTLTKRIDINKRTRRVVPMKKALRIIFGTVAAVMSITYTAQWTIDAFTRESLTTDIKVEKVMNNSNLSFIKLIKSQDGETYQYFSRKRNKIEDGELYEVTYLKHSKTVVEIEKTNNN